MRIRLVQAFDADKSGITAMTFDLLKGELEKMDGVVLADENPDVIHIIGGWETKSRTIAKDAQTRFIALVHTPLASLSPWFKPASGNIELSTKATALVSTGDMEQELLDDGSKSNLQMIPNAIVTNTTTAEKMAQSYMELYRHAIDTNEEALHKEVAKQIDIINEQDEKIAEICRNFLYAEYLSKRRNIPQQFLDNLSQLMTESDYDEAHMQEVLKLIKLDVFVQHLEAVMKSHSTLTEGFMPIHHKDDKQSATLATYITAY